MKSFLKAIAAALFATLALAACGGAHAASPIAVVNATGDKVSGTDSILWARKDTSSGNRVKVRLLGGLESFIEDDAGWNKFAKIKAGMGVAVTAPTAADSLTYDISKPRDIVCAGGQSSISYSYFAYPDNIADGCAFFNAAKAAANAL